MNWSLVLGIVSLAINVLMGIILAYIASKQGEIKDLKTKLEQATRAQVDERLRAWESQCCLKHQQIAQVISQMEQRLEDGDNHFDTVDQRNHKIELVVATKIAEMKDWMRETFVSKSDLQTFMKAMRNSNQS